MNQATEQGDAVGLAVLIGARREPLEGMSAVQLSTQGVSAVYGLVSWRWMAGHKAGHHRPDQVARLDGDLGHRGRAARQAPQMTTGLPRFQRPPKNRA